MKPFLSLMWGFVFCSSQTSHLNKNKHMGQYHISTGFLNHTLNV